MALIEMDFAAGVGGKLPPYLLSDLRNNGYTISSAVASTTYPDSRFTVDHSYDGSGATAWLPAALGNSVPYNVVYDLGNVKDFGGIYIQFATSDEGIYVTTVEISGSTDGSHYTTIIPTTQMNISNGWNNQTATIPTGCNYILLNESYRYIKIAFSRISGTANYCVGIGEINVYGEI